MAFTVGALRGSDGSRGLVDHRLARRMLINQVQPGRVPIDQVCDAHPELIRAARNVGTETSTCCPICEEADLRLVTYVFGHGIGRRVGVCRPRRRCALNDRPEDLSAYVVEACIECRWHHLLRVLPVGGRRRRRSAPLDDAVVGRAPPVAHRRVDAAALAVRLAGCVERSRRRLERGRRASSPVARRRRGDGTDIEATVPTRAPTKAW